MSNGGQLITADLDHLAQQLSGHPDYRLVRRLAPRTHYAQPDGRLLLKGIIVDTETTGMRPGQDKIIELGMVAFEFEPQSGQAFRILESYNALEDPGIPIPTEATDIHGITDDMVAGKKFDDATVARLADGASIVIAHNAGFDRPFLESRFPFFETFPWGCSHIQINWKDEGLASQKLEYIAYRMGFFYEAHRAEADCLALLEALQGTLPKSGSKPLKSILAQYLDNDCRVWARGSRFDTKDMLKERLYKWDAEEKCWYKTVTERQLEAECDWLKQAIYGGRPASIEYEVLDAYSRFSRRGGRKVKQAI